MAISHRSFRTRKQMLLSHIYIALGAFLSAFAIHSFLIPNYLIDGGVIGIAMILIKLTSNSLFPFYFLCLTLPFIFLSYLYIRRTFFIQMMIAVLFFTLFLFVLGSAPVFEELYELEVILIGGTFLGVGTGLIIRAGGCLDGSEILAIIISRRKGFTVGQVIFFINLFIFAIYGWIFVDWHVAFRSLLTYLVAFKIMDIVIVGLDELKSVTIISQKPKEVGEAIMHELGLGLTIMYGRGGYTGDAREILLVIVERLDLSDLKEIVLNEDPTAFMAVETLHEVVGKHTKVPTQKQQVGRKKRKKTKGHRQKTSKGDAT